MLLHSRCNSFRRRIYSAAPHNLAGIVDDANRGFLQRYIEADILTALGHGLAPLALRGTSTIPVPRLRHVPACTLCGASRAGTVKAGRRSCLGSSSSVSRPRLDGPEYGATLTQVGTRRSCPGDLEVALLVENRPDDTGELVG